MGAKQEKINKIVLLFVMLLLGVVISMQVKVVFQENNKSAEQNRKRLESYVTRLNQLDEETSRLKTEIEALDYEYKTKLQQMSLNNTGFYETIQTLNEKMKTNKIIAGLADVEGAGIEIRLDDAQVTSEGNYNFFIVHDIFLTEIINDLRDAGAQAISINGERIMPMSEQLCLGPSVGVNGKKLFAPFIIKAIGNPEVLEKQLKEGKIYNDIISKNLLFDLTIQNNIIIKKYNGNYLKQISIFEEVKE